MHAWILLVAMSCWQVPSHQVIFPSEASCRASAPAITAAVIHFEDYASPWTLCVRADDAAMVLHALTTSERRDCAYPG